MYPKCFPASVSQRKSHEEKATTDALFEAREKFQYAYLDMSKS